jgi:stage IV sporulation protein FB
MSLKMLSFRGIPVRIHLSFALLLAFLFWRTGTAADYRVAALQSGLVMLLFACVGLHEIGHAVAAMRYSIPITEITLYPYGGLARMARRPPDGWAELTIAAAGPAVNLLLAAILFAAGGGFTAEQGQSLFWLAIDWLFWANLLIAGFNLIPAFPLDGGRVLRGALSARLGWTRATIWSASAGQVTALLLMAAGLVHNPWLLLAGVLLFPGANSELRLALSLRSLERSTVRELMLSDVQLVAPEVRLESLAQVSRDELISEFIVHDGERALGFLPAGRLWSLLQSSATRSSTVVEAALGIGAPVAEDAPVSEALESLDEDQSEAAPVVDGRGTIVGVITRSALTRARSLTRHLAKRE